MRHRGRGDFRGRFPGHVTLKVVLGLRSLRDGRILRALEATLRAACERGSFRVVAYSVQGDHLHLIVEAADRAALGRGMKSIAARVARAHAPVCPRPDGVLVYSTPLRSDSANATSVSESLLPDRPWPPAAMTTYWRPSAS